MGKDSTSKALAPTSKMESNPLKKGFSDKLHTPGKVPHPLWASVSSSVKWG